MKKVIRTLAWIAAACAWAYALRLIWGAILGEAVPTPGRYDSDYVTYAESPIEFLITMGIMVIMAIAIPIFAVSHWRTERLMDERIARRASRPAIDKAIRRSSDGR